MDGIAGHYVAAARERDIGVDAAFASGSLNLSGSGLCAIVGNLMENAMEAQ